MWSWSVALKQFLCLRWATYCWFTTSNVDLLSRSVQQDKPCWLFILHHQQVKYFTQPFRMNRHVFTAAILPWNNRPNTCLADDKGDSSILFRSNRGALAGPKWLKWKKLHCYWIKNISDTPVSLSCTLYSVALAYNMLTIDVYLIKGAYLQS